MICFTQVYEMCLILCNHDDHNVTTTSLETLQQLLSEPASQVCKILTSEEGIQNSFDCCKWDAAPIDQIQLSAGMP